MFLLMCYVWAPIRKYAVAVLFDAEADTIIPTPKLTRNIQDKRVLVTGGAGFIGSNLANRLAADNDMIAVDDTYLGTPENLDSDVEFVEASVVDGEFPVDVDVVFHLAALNGTEPDDLRAFLRDVLVTNVTLRERFFARFGEPVTRSVDELRAAIDRRFEETNPDYYVVFEPIDFAEWFDLANEHREEGRNAAAAAVYRALVESLDDNMDRVDGAYDQFSQAFSRALDDYIVRVVATDREANAVTDAVSFLEQRAASGTQYLTDQFERAATELRAKLDEGTSGE